MQMSFSMTDPNTPDSELLYELRTSPEKSKIFKWFKIDQKHKGNLLGLK